MKIKKNELKIIQILLASKDYISTYEISTITGISRRTIREEINNVKSILKDYDVFLSSKPNKGYFIEEKTPEKIQILQHIIDNNENVLDTAVPDSPDARVNHIIKLLSESNDYIKIDDIADQLLVSRATIANDLINVKKEFKRHNLKIIQKPNYGIKLIGDEVNRRKSIADTMFSDMNNRQIYYDFLDTYMDSNDYEIIRIIKNHHICLGDLSLIDFLINYSVSIARNMAGYSIETPFENFEIFRDSDEYKASIEIAQSAEKRYGIHLADYEIQFFTIMMVCKGSTKYKTLKKDPLTMQMVHEILNKIYSETLIKIKPAYHSRLALYIQIALIRQKYMEKIRTPLYKNIKYDMPLAFYLTQIVSHTVKEHTGCLLSRSEITAFTIFFNNIINEQTDHRKKALLINCMGYFASNYNINIIENELLNDLIVKKCISYSEIKNENLDDYDLIISNAPIHKKYPLPTINTEYIITMDDIIRIKSDLTYYFNNENLAYYFHPYLFENAVRTKTKKGIATTIFQILERLYPQLKSSVKSNYINKNKYTLHCFNNSIGLLKLNTPFNSNTNNVILTFQDPIKYDDKRFQILITFSSYDENNIMYDTLYNTLNKISQNESLISKLINSSSYTDFLTILIENK